MGEMQLIGIIRKPAGEVHVRSDEFGVISRVAMFEIDFGNEPMFVALTGRMMVNDRLPQPVLGPLDTL